MSKPTSLPAHYDAVLSEATYTEAWERAGHAKGDPKHPGKPYSIILPPPNVTGSLHMGHALNNTLQDALVRYRRMDGDSVVWIPGFDHASIAVHWVLERKLHAEGKTRKHIGRDKFLQMAWAFKEQSQAAILAQQKRLGVSCDYSRLAFTLDEPRTQAVREAFVKLYRDGLIYRANRLVNWDPVSQTSVSDLEVVHDENVKGELYSFAYLLSDGSGELVVATTRPETMLGDTAVAVHPKDPRYVGLIGKTLRHPLVDRHIPIIADPILVDPKFGTGAVKITPAHDFNDFAVGQRHKLESINLLNLDGTLNANAGEFAGLKVPDARSQVKARLLALGLERGSEEHLMSVGRSERSGAVLEPMLSTQWYVRAKPLAAPAVAAIKHKFARFVPEGWENTYFSWLTEIRDWCISRQLWWGHQIPAYYCTQCDHLHVAACKPEACEACEHSELRQDDDVLDTWFSSALWPFSTQGWPERSEDLAKWYPTQVVVTSFDIIFFWVARMMMFGLYFTGNVPFKDIYIHALIRDAKGEKMSKTKGNVVDPLEMIERYGCDAFRFTLVALAGQGRDVRWDESRAQGYQKFINKVWQAYRFASAQIGEGAVVPQLASVTLGVFDRWILGRLQVAIERTRLGLDSYRFNDAAQAIYSFVWDELCDWYLEVAKTTLYDEQANGAAQDAVRRVLLECFGAVSRLMHPICPFLAEELYQRLRHQDEAHPLHGQDAPTSVMVAAYPKTTDYTLNAEALAEANFIQHTITAVRRLRAEFNVAIKQDITVIVQGTPAQHGQIMPQAQVLRALCRAKLQWQDEGALPHPAAMEVVQGCTLCVPLAGIVDVAAELARLKKELTKCAADEGRINAQLGRADFLARAPQEVVEDKHRQLAILKERQQRLSDAASRLQAG